MNFDFSADAKTMGVEAARFLRDRAPLSAARRILDGADSHDRSLWQSLSEMGWTGVTIPEEHGGSALGYEVLCLLAMELGASLAPVPFSSSVYLATEALLAAGSGEQKAALLPRLAAGTAIGTFALAEGAGNPACRLVTARVRDGKLTGTKTPVPDGQIADFAIVAARDIAEGAGLYLADLRAPGIRIAPVSTIDPSRNHAALVFEDTPVEPLRSPGPAGWAGIARLLDRAAILTAFEQVGGAQACLTMARDYAMDRHAFGRPIGSFQALKHKLADIYIAVELARAHAYYGAWALAHDAPELPQAAAAARVAASNAYFLAAKENIQIHGGMGMTWDLDCHLFYRRAKLSSVSLGSTPYWKDRLIAELAAPAKAG